MLRIIPVVNRIAKKAAAISRIECFHLGRRWEKSVTRKTCPRLLSVKRNARPFIIDVDCRSIYVNAGDSVSQGTVIAGVGTTGNSTGNHLHLEIRVNGVAKNPQNYLYN